MTTTTTTTTSAGTVTKPEVIIGGIVITKYLGPTNHRGSRVKATSGAGRTVTVSWDSELDSHDNHAAAAALLVEQVLCLSASQITLVGGVLPSDGGYAFAVLRK